MAKSIIFPGGFHFAVLGDRGTNIEAALPVYEVRSWMTGNRLVSAPFATLFDPLEAGPDQLLPLLNAIINKARERRSRHIELRTLRAEDEADLLDFYALLDKTRKRNALPPQPYKFFSSIWRVFRPANRLALLMAIKDGVPIAALMLLTYKDRVSAEFLASDESLNSLSPVHFLFWQAIQWARGEGFGIFDFGRTSSKNKGLMDFKIRWGTSVLTLSQFYFPPQAAERATRQELTWKYRLVQFIASKHLTDPLRRRLGDFCYRHLG